MDFLVFKAGKYVCTVRSSTESETAMKSGALMEVVRVNIDDENVDVLHIFDMDYGIVIPSHIANKINEIVDGSQSEK